MSKLKGEISSGNMVMLERLLVTLLPKAIISIKAFKPVVEKREEMSPTVTWNERKFSEIGNKNTLSYCQKVKKPTMSHDSSKTQEFSKALTSTDHS